MSDLTYRQNPRTAGRVIDGLAFVVTPDDNKLHSLNVTGTFIWQLAETGRTVGEVAAFLARRFDVPAERARGDAARFCEDLRERGILELLDEGRG
jgi:hypothetical protein